MKLLIQRVNFAKVKINNQVYSKIGNGYLIFLAIHNNDNEKNIEFVINKLINLSLFEGANSYFSKSIGEVKGEILVVSQFTLYGNLKKGKKPSFTKAMKPEQAEIIYNKFIKKLKERYDKVKSGKFAAYMKIELENNGPATFLLES